MAMNFETGNTISLDADGGAIVTDGITISVSIPDFEPTPVIRNIWWTSRDGGDL